MQGLFWVYKRQRIAPAVMVLKLVELETAASRGMKLLVEGSARWWSNVRLIRDRGFLGRTQTGRPF